MSLPAILDHIVINARFNMDDAEDLFSRMGFTLTPRGRHTMGSINHLMMFADDYLELIGIGEADADKRPDVSQAPLGLNGLVFKTENADQAFERLGDNDMAGDPPRAFSRPLVLDDGSRHEAAFRTATARSDAFPAGRLYFCEHLTPELLWRAEWLSHPNGVTGFTELMTVCVNPEEDAERVGGLLAIAPDRAREDAPQIAFASGFRLTFVTPEAYTDRFGDLAVSTTGRDACFGALGLRCENPEALFAALEDCGDAVTVVRQDASAVVLVQAFDTLLRFDF